MEEGQENLEVEQTEEVSDNQTEVQSEEQETPIEDVADRPEKNYRAEIARKNAENERLRQELEAAKQNVVKRHDPTDLSTWGDHELKAVLHSNDPSVMAIKDQANDILLERKVNAIRERERITEKKISSEQELRAKYPEALDPTSDFAFQMEQVIYKYDLQKSPAGRLAAAKIVAAEMGKGHSKAKALDRQQDTSRVRDVKAQMVDGDRSKPTDAVSPKKEQALRDKIVSEGRLEAKALGEMLNQRGISKDSFFKK